jgi:hypothetical protein
MKHPSASGADSRRDARARDWERTASVALFVAVGAGVIAAAGHWDPGDLVVGVYFAAVSLLLWVQSARIRLSGSTAPFTQTVRVALVLAFCIGVLLGALDIITGGAA